MSEAVFRIVQGPFCLNVAARRMYRSDSIFQRTPQLSLFGADATLLTLCAVVS